MASLKKIASDIFHGKLPLSAKDDVVKMRLQICETCPEFTKISRQCKQCGCFMDLKVKLLESECPLQMW